MVKFGREVGVLEGVCVEIFCGNVPRGTFFGDPVLDKRTDAESAEVVVFTWNVGGFRLGVEGGLGVTHPTINALRLR